jgi:hypothetical protein
VRDDAGGGEALIVGSDRQGKTLEARVLPGFKFLGGELKPIAPNLGNIFIKTINRVDSTKQ